MFLHTVNLNHGMSKPAPSVPNGSDYRPYISYGETKLTILFLLSKHFDTNTAIP